jgi:hypothetical protein
MRGSNPRHSQCKCDALPTELIVHIKQRAESEVHRVDYYLCTLTLAQCLLVRMRGLEPPRLLGTATSRLRVYQFHHIRVIK